jgi:hypothetical protein
VPTAYTLAEEFRQLGMTKSKAGAILRKSLLFDFAKKLGLHFCFDAEKNLQLTTSPSIIRSRGFTWNPSYIGTWITSLFLMTRATRKLNVIGAERKAVQRIQISGTLRHCD